MVWGRVGLWVRKRMTASDFSKKEEADLPIVQTSAKLYGERTVPTAKHVHCAKDVNRLREPV
jgi:hypothetical protein